MINSKSLTSKIVLFFSIVFLFLFLIYEKNEQVDVLKDKIKTTHVNQINSAINQYSSSNMFIFNGFINDEDILLLQKKALDTKDKDLRKVYRDKLHNKLAKLYAHLKDYGIKQLHFHFPDTTTFLRFHKPSKYGDNLEDIRYSLVVANKELKIVSGFEEGRIFNGYRFVYPLIYKKEHIGSVEISIGFNAINNISQNNYKIFQYMILNEDVVYGKVFSGKKKNYEISGINNHFYHESNSFSNYKNEFNNVNNISIDIFNKINEKLKNVIDDKTLLNYKHKVKFIEIDGNNYSASLLPIKNIKKQNIGYIISYERCECINGINNEFYMKIFLFTILISLFIYFFFKNEYTKDKLKSLNENLYEITEEKTKELRKYLNIVNKNITISTVNLDGEFIYVNEAFCKLYGYEKNELIGNKHDIIRYPDSSNEYFKEMWTDLKLGKNWHKKVKNIKKDGKYCWIDLNVEPTFDLNNKIVSYSSIGIDITDKIELEDLIKNQNIIITGQVEIANMQRDKALEASKSKSEFLANMSHEIRTPLNAIMGFIELLKEKEEDKEKQKYLDIVNSSSKSLLGIINDILDFSKIESGKFEIDNIDFNPISEFKVTKKLFKAKTDEKNIHLHVSYNELPKSLYGDILRIKQVINNLISNAVKFTKSGKNIYLDIEYSNEKLNVFVKDEGIGISKEYQNNIFEAFTQEDSSTTRKYGGTGLGLTISHRIVKLLGGELKLKSEVDVGSEFYFSIPVELGKNIVKDEENEKIIDFNKKNILLVEDNMANQMFMKVILKKMNINFDIASDGLEAVEMFKQEKYDAILMDENMPNMGGIEATKHILEYEKENNIIHTPIIALTANALKGDRERFLSAGMDEYLTKPLDKKRLYEVLNSFLEIK